MARIGVIDSGYGGLSFVQAYANKSKQNHTIIYVGDNARAPYGVRSVDELFQFAKELIDNLVQQHCVDMVVVACGTIATNVLGKLQAHYSLPIYGISQQLFEIERVWNAPIGVIATEKTVSSHYFQNRFVEKDLEAIVTPTQSFVEIVEGRKVFDVVTFKAELSAVEQCQTLILGCTHFPFLKNEIAEILPNVELIDPADSFLNLIEALPSEESRSFYYKTSGDTDHFEQFLIKNNLPKGEIVHENFNCLK